MRAPLGVRSLGRLASRLRIRRAHKVGLSPGALVPVEPERAVPTHISVIDYDAEGFEERVVLDPGESGPPRAGAAGVRWLNVDGLGDIELVERFVALFDIHPLVLEDVLSGGQRPKLEEYDGYLYLVFRMLTLDESEGQVVDEQVSVILGPGYVLSLQERVGDVFGTVRERIRNGKGRIRRMGADYLAYCLLDAVVDHYFVVLEHLAEQVETLETELIDDPTPRTLHAIHRMKRELLFLRRSVWPLREVISALQRSDTDLLSPETRVFVRDVYDHTVQVIDTAETFRDMVAGMLDTYLSSLSHRMNEIMKVLTIIATIFIPITFVAGVYGMNFEFMPELDQRWGYPAALIGMAVMAVGMLAWFRRRGWL